MAPLSFLSEEWLTNLADGAAGLPEQPGVDGVVRFVVTSTPHGKVQFRLVVSDGRVAEVLVGRDGEAEATVTWKYADAVAQFRGDLSRRGLHDRSVQGGGRLRPLRVRPPDSVRRLCMGRPAG